MSRSIYQTNGKPLSQQAIYQQKLKQGVYTSPSAASIGVDSSASDTAALLAATSDLTVKPSYERVVAKDAHTAALAAKQNNIKAWSRDQTHAYADAAAVASAGRTSTLSSVTSSVSTGVPSLNHDALFKTASTNSTSTMTSRINPEKDVMRSGIKTGGSTSASTLGNIGKISQIASQNSTKSLNSRFNPELDYRSGLKTTEYLTDAEESLAASGAAASLKHGGSYSTQVSQQRRSNTLIAENIVDARLMAAANANAQERLKSISLSSNQDFKQQAVQYAAALSLAQKRSDERVQQNKLGLIQLGGGLTMLQSEINALASQIVQPVLADIDVKAGAQRELDSAAKVRQAELAELHERHKQEQVQLKSQERADYEIAKQKRTAANEESKKEQDTIFEDHKAERLAVLEGKKVDFETLKTEQATQHQELVTEQEENTARILEEETALKKERKDEVDALQAEKDALIKPTLDELAEETSKLKSLTDAHAGLTDEVAAAEKLNTEYELKIKELEELLESTKTEIDQYTTDLETATATHEATSKEVEELQGTSVGLFAKHDETDKDLDAKLQDLSEQQATYLADKETQKQVILSELDAKVKDEHKINSELPEHLQGEVNESKLRDTTSLFSAEEPEPVIEDVVPPKEPEPVVVPTPKVAPAPKEEKKRSGLRRLSALFKGSKKDKKKAVYAAPSTPPPAKAAAAAAVAPVASAAAKAPSVHSSVKPSKTTSIRPASQFTTDTDEIVSLNKDTDKNQGGLFTEEI